MSYDQKEIVDENIKAYERSWLKPYIDTIPVWHDLAYTRRHFAKEKKRFRLWRLLPDGQPQLLSDLFVADFNCGLQGPVMSLQSPEGGSIQITHAPQELFPGSLIYLWIPAFFDARFTPARYDTPATHARRLTWRFCARMGANPFNVERRKTDQVFISDDEEFRRLWPTFNC